MTEVGDFETCSWCNAVMYSKKFDCCISIYVDDVCISIDADKEEALLDLIKERFKCDSLFDCRKFLGTRIDTIDTDDYFYVRMGMSEYIEEISTMYAQLFPDLPLKNKLYPGSQEFRPSTTESIHDAKNEKYRTGHYRQKIQILLGMCLWLTRSCRPDCIGIVCMLCSQVHIWSADCMEALRSLISFLWTTRQKSLFWRIEKGVDMFCFQFFDSDLKAPKSQGCWMLMLMSEDSNSRICLDWGSKKMSVCSLSSAASELFALSQAVTVGLAICEWLNRRVLFEPVNPPEAFLNVPMLLVGDNVAALKVLKKGYSDMNHLYPDDKMSFSEAKRSLPRAAMLRIGMLHDLYTASLIRGLYIESARNCADIGTKVLSRPIFTKLAVNLGVCWDCNDFDSVCSASTLKVDLTSTINRTLLSTIC